MKLVVALFDLLNVPITATNHVTIYDFYNSKTVVKNIYE
jgi:hypothetical protein